MALQFIDAVVGVANAMSEGFKMSQPRESPLQRMYRRLDEIRDKGGYVIDTTDDRPDLRPYGEGISQLTPQQRSSYYFNQVYKDAMRMRQSS